MLVNLKEILEIAEEKNYALAAFTTPTLENIVAALKVAERYNVPIILQHAEVHESIVSIDYLGPVLVALAKNAKIPVCVQIDHGESMEFIKKGLDYGFTSVMYDGSKLPIEENIKNTKKVVKLADGYGASVEAELGIMNEENDIYQTDDLSKFYTDPKIAADFVKQTEITALAAVFGTSHGFYEKEPNLDFNLVKDIRTETKLPIVMHGGSGLTTEDYKRVIKNGVRKINYYSYSARAALKATESLIKTKKPKLFDEVVSTAIGAIEKDYEKIIKIFYNL